MERKFVEKRKMVQITHCDLDGVVSAIVGKVYAAINGYHHIVRFTQPGAQCNAEIEKAIYKKCDFLLITDLSLNKEICEKIDKSKINVMACDHHEDNGMDKYMWATLIQENKQGKQCGASIAYHKLIKVECRDKFTGKNLSRFKALEMLVEKTRLYDTWEWKKQNDILPRELSRLCAASNRFFNEKFNDIMDASNKQFNLLTENDLRILHSIDIKINNYIINKMKCVTSNYIRMPNNKLAKAAIVFADTYQSELGSRILNETDNTVVIMIDVNSCRVSIRSNGEFDISEYAKAKGGNGHHDAAGFPIDIKAMVDTPLTELLLL